MRLISGNHCIYGDCFLEILEGFYPLYEELDNISEDIFNTQSIRFILIII